MPSEIESAKKGVEQANRVKSWVVLTALWLMSLYFLALPLIRPHGLYLWGHHKLSDLYLGVPIALAAMCLTLVLAAPPKKQRPLALRVTAVYLSILFTLTLVDAGYTLVYLRAGKANFWFDTLGVKRKGHLPHPELGYVVRPYTRWRGKANPAAHLITYRIDEHGFRNPLKLRQADIAFIGDSYTEAAQVAEEDTFVQRVGRALGTSVVNLGVGGYAPQQERIVLEKFGLTYQPKTIVWQFFEGNDLRDAENFDRWKRGEPYQAPSLLRRYLDNSLVNELFTQTLPAEREFPNTVWGKLRLPDGSQQRLYLGYPYLPDEPQWRTLGAGETARALESGYRLCRSRGINLLVVFIPSMPRVLEPGLTFDNPADRERHFPGGRVTDPRDFGSMLQELCRKLNCPYLDTFPALAQQAKKDNRALYVLTDEHLDTRGHQVVADLLVQRLKGMGVQGTGRSR